MNSLRSQPAFIRQMMSFLNERSLFPQEAIDNGYKLLHKKHEEEALILFRYGCEHLETHPNEIFKAYIGIARCYINLEKFQDAHAALKKAFTVISECTYRQKIPNQDMYYQTLTSLYLRQGDTENARKFLVQVHNQNSIVTQFLYLKLIMATDKEKALKKCQEIEEKFADTTSLVLVDVYISHAILLKAKDAIKAIKVFNSLSLLWKQNLTSYEKEKLSRVQVFRASCYLKLGNLKKAFNYVSLGHNLDPEYAMAAHVFAICHKLNNNPDEAEVWQDKAAKLDPKRFGKQIADDSYQRNDNVDDFIHNSLNQSPIGKVNVSSSNSPRDTKVSVLGSEESFLERLTHLREQEENAMHWDGEDTKPTSLNEVSKHWEDDCNETTVSLDPFFVDRNAFENLYDESELSDQKADSKSEPLGKHSSEKSVEFVIAKANSQEANSTEQPVLQNPKSKKGLSKEDQALLARDRAIRQREERIKQRKKRREALARRKLARQAEVKAQQDQKVEQVAFIAPQLTEEENQKVLEAARASKENQKQAAAIRALEEKQQQERENSKTRKHFARQQHLFKSLQDAKNKNILANEKEKARHLEKKAKKAEKDERERIAAELAAKQKAEKNLSLPYRALNYVATLFPSWRNQPTQNSPDKKLANSDNAAKRF